jgi:mRNA interferase MazF
MNYGSLKRGEVYYVFKYDVSAVGSEQGAGRPAVIVSNNVGNIHSSIVEVVFLTTKPKTDLPTHVSLSSTAKASIALCEQITTLDTCKLGEYMCTLSDAEMSQIDTALSISLGLQNAQPQPSTNTTTSIPAPSAELQTMRIERDMYKRLYDTLIEKLLK